VSELRRVKITVMMRMLSDNLLIASGRSPAWVKQPGTIILCGSDCVRSTIEFERTD